METCSPGIISLMLYFTWFLLRKPFAAFLFGLGAALLIGNLFPILEISFTVANRMNSVLIGTACLFSGNFLWSNEIETKKRLFSFFYKLFLFMVFVLAIIVLYYMLHGNAIAWYYFLAFALSFVTSVIFGGMSDNMT